MILSAMTDEQTTERSSERSQPQGTKMRTIYEATFYDESRKYTIKEFVERADAEKAVEAAGSGSITTFHIHPNAPDLLPAEVYRSIELRSYDGKGWREINIF